MNSYSDSDDSDSVYNAHNGNGNGYGYNCRACDRPDSIFSVVCDICENKFPMNKAFYQDRMKFCSIICLRIFHDAIIEEKSSKELDLLVKGKIFSFYEQK